MADERILVTAAELVKALTPGDLDETLQRVTNAAVELLPDVTMASITIKHRDGSLETAAPTDALLCDIDAYQYDMREGPCYEAAVDEPHVISSNLAADERFPNYGKRAVEAGIRSQAGLRLFDNKGSQGALNLYSPRVGAFGDLEELATFFTHQAAVAIGYAREVQGLKDALETRALIGQAVGVVMQRYSMNDQRAFAFLTRLSSHRNVKLKQVAAEIVGEVGQDPEQGHAPS
jgi:GAF domain-containing protein